MEIPSAFFGIPHFHTAIYAYSFSFLQKDDNTILSFKKPNTAGKTRRFQSYPNAVADSVASAVRCFLYAGCYSRVSFLRFPPFRNANFLRIICIRFASAADLLNCFCCWFMHRKYSRQPYIHPASIL
jgi:hypothetical protein